MISIENLLLIGALLILFSIVVARAFNNLGVPTLILFLVVGMVAGENGIGRIHFNDYEMARSIGIIALVIILFSGGLDTVWRSVRPAAWSAFSLSTLGVMITMVLIASFTHFVFHAAWISSLLLGAVISATDVAAVFSILSSQRFHLRQNVRSLLELESGSNDPMAVFLTVALISLALGREPFGGHLLLLFLRQMGLGAIAGLLLGKGLALLLNRVRFTYDGIYPVVGLAWAFFTFAFTDRIGGSGFLAVYIAGIVAANNNMVHKRSLLRFFDGMAWLAQIGLFLVLGLLVTPSGLPKVAPRGFLIAAALIFAARPVAVFCGLAFSKYVWREKLFISWVGLRGAAPIILATFPVLAGLPESGTFFNAVFFIVFTSAALQGWTLPFAARLLEVTVPVDPVRASPLKFAPPPDSDTELMEFILPYNSRVSGRAVVDLKLPEDALVVLICRQDRFFVPGGGTVLEDQDIIQVLVGKKGMPKVREIFSSVIVSTPTT